MSIRLVAASAAVLVLSASGLAARVPELSGAYIVTYNEICEASANSDGRSHSDILLATFDPVAGTATLSGKDVNGAVRTNNESPLGYVTDPITGTEPYTNSKDKLTLGGETYNIIYGRRAGQQVEAAVFNGITRGGACAASAMAIHQ